MALMSRKNHIIIIILISLCTFLFAGCLNSQGSTTAETRLAIAEVIKIAEKAARAEGYDIRKYNMTGCHYEFTRKDKSWTVFFELKPPTPPGGHFMITIDDQTGKATLSRGE